ncbi:fasciclin domain-containing protein [Phycicoccus jejuensis]|uniref:fasciclin domain-containing protein n=1 Tax=Phycicoccus jejuensis TaxID=367299 RepID=UPI00384E8541
MRRTLAATAALSLALVVSACGSDSDTDAGASTPATSSAAPTSASPSASESAAASADIVDTAVAAGGFTTLATALEAAGLVETLKGEGPYTVFAPTDEAFTALPDGTLDDLLADPQGALTDVLTYHVVPGKVMAADVATMDGQEVETVNGEKLTIGVDGDTVTLTDTSGGEVTVTQTDIEATNGVIHVIDGVLVPKG